MDQCFGMLAASRSTFALKKLDLRDQSPVELAHPLASQPFELFQAPLALSDEPRDIYTEGLRLELPEALGAVAEQARCPAPVAVLLVVEADTNLEDALVEEADPPGLLHPGLLEVLVALVELAPVELLYAPEGELGELLWGLHPPSRSRNPHRNSRHRPPCARPLRGWWRGPRRQALWRRSWRSHAATPLNHTRGTRLGRRLPPWAASGRSAPRTQRTCTRREPSLVPPLVRQIYSGTHCTAKPPYIEE